MPDFNFEAAWQEAHAETTEPSGETGEVAAPQTNETQTETEQEVIETETEPEGEETPESEVVDQTEKTSKQSPELDAAFAKARRAEKEAEQLRQQQDQWVRENFGATHGLNTWAEYQQAIAQTRQQVAQQTYQNELQQFQEQGYDVDGLFKLFNMHPALQQVQMVINELQRQQQASQRNQEEQVRAQQIESGAKFVLDEFTSIKQKYPELAPYKVEGGSNVEKFDSLLAQLPSEITERLKRGYTFADAWELVNKDKLIDHARKSAEQRARNAVSGKSHMKTETGGSDVDSTTVPEEIKEQYRAMLGWSDEKIAEHYKKSNPKRRG